MNDMSNGEAIRTLKMEDKYPWNADRPQLRQALRVAIEALEAVQPAGVEEAKPHPKRFTRRK